jgi:hypothetical protein
MPRLISSQAGAARNAIQDKKLELVSLLLRPDSGDEYKNKMKELVDVARRHRESLVLECVPVFFFFFPTSTYVLSRFRL